MNTLSFKKKLFLHGGQPFSRAAPREVQVHKGELDSSGYFLRRNGAGELRKTLNSLPQAHNATPDMQRQQIISPTAPGQIRRRSEGKSSHTTLPTWGQDPRISPLCVPPLDLFCSQIRPLALSVRRARSRDELDACAQGGLNQSMWRHVYPQRQENLRDLLPMIHSSG